MIWIGKSHGPVGPPTRMKRGLHVDLPLTGLSAMYDAGTRLRDVPPEILDIFNI